MTGKRSAIGAIVLLALAALVVAGAISASSGDAGKHGANAIVGSWEATVDRGPAFPSLTTFGTWEYVGDRTFATTMVLHRFSPTGVYLGTGRINANRRLSQDGETYTAVAVLEIRDPAGNVLVSGLRSTAIGKRIDVERIPDQP